LKNQSKVIQENIVLLPKQTGLDELDFEDIQELMDCQKKELITGEHMEIKRERAV
jgi:hypothetical protein